MVTARHSGTLLRNGSAASAFHRASIVCLPEPRCAVFGAAEKGTCVRARVRAREHAGHTESCSEAARSRHFGSVSVKPGIVPLWHSWPSFKPRTGLRLRLPWSLLPFACPGSWPFTQARGRPGIVTGDTFPGVFDRAVRPYQSAPHEPAPTPSLLRSGRGAFAKLHIELWPPSCHSSASGTGACPHTYTAPLSDLSGISMDGARVRCVVHQAGV